MRAGMMAVARPAAAIASETSRRLSAAVVRGQSMSRTADRVANRVDIGAPGGPPHAGGEERDGAIEPARCSEVRSPCPSGSRR